MPQSDLRLIKRCAEFVSEMSRALLNLRTE